MKDKFSSIDVGMRLGRRMGNHQGTSNLSPTNHQGHTRGWQVIFTFLLVLAMSIGNVWADDPTIATKTYGTTSHTYLDVAGTTSNAVIKNGPKCVTFGAVYLNSIKSSSAWLVTDLSTSNSNITISSYSYADNGFLTYAGNSTPTYTQAYGQYSSVKSNATVEFWVTGTTGVAIIGQGNGSSKYVVLHIDEVSTNGTTLNAVGTDVKQKNSAAVLAHESTLDPAKYYKVTVTADNTSNNKFGQIRFTQPYKVTVNPDGGSTSTSGWTLSDGKYIKYVAASTSLTLPTMTKDANTFDGWKDSHDNAIVSPLTVTKDTTLIAQWTPAGGNSHDITYTNLKGSDVSAYPTKYYEGVGVASFEALADVTDFHFTGWSPASIAADATTDQTIEAQWVNAYNVTFALGTGGGTAPASFQKWAGASFDLPDQGEMEAPTGAAFAGWLCNIDSEVKAAGASYTMTAAATTFTAQWKLENDAVFNGTTCFTDAAVNLVGLFSSTCTGAVTYSLKEASEHASVTGTSFTADEAGSYVVVATQAADATYAGVEKEATITVVAAPTHLVENRLVTTNKADWGSSIYTTDGTNITNLSAFNPSRTGEGAINVNAKTANGTRSSNVSSYATENADNYMVLSFTVAEGKRLRVSAASVRAFSVGTQKNHRAWITDADGNKIVEGTITLAKDGVDNVFKDVDFSETTVYLKGTNYLKLWTWGETDGYRLETPIYIDGTISDLPATYAVTYTAGGGSVKEGKLMPTQAATEAGGKFNLASGENLEKSGFTFAGWKANGAGETLAAGSEYTMTAAAVEFVAQWISNANKVQIVETSTGYETFAGAIAAVADGQTIKLLDDCSYDAIWNINGKTVTLDLNGKDLTYTGSARGVEVQADAKLILMDGTATVAPTIDLTADPMTVNAITYTSGTFNSNDGMRVIAGGEIEFNSGRYIAKECVVFVKYTGKVTVKDGVLICTNNAVLSGNGTVGWGGYTITVEGGILYGQNPTDAADASMAIYHPNTGTLNISGGTLVSEDGPAVVVRGGVSNITGGTIVAQGSGSGKCGDASLVLPAVGVAYDFKANYPGVASFDAEITGGTISGQGGAVMGNYAGATPSAAEIAAVAISGGTFSSAVAEALCAENYAPKDNGDGTYGVKPLAQSIDMEQFVLDNGKGGNWQAYLTSKGYTYAASNMSLDSLDNTKTKNNYQYLGLKFEKNSTNTFVSGILPANKLMVVKVGAIGDNTYMKINDTKVTNPAIVGGVAADSAAAYTYWYYNEDKTFSLFHESGGTSMLKGITITDPYVVTFDANGGDPVAPATFYGTAITLPSAMNGTESFLGWFDAAEGGNKIGEANEEYIPTADIELFAHWEAVSTDARLASITFSSNAGTLVPAFDPEVVNYTYTMPYPTAEIPTIVSATSVNANAQEPVIEAQAANWNDVAVIRGKAQSGDTKAYNITMKLAPKDGVSVIKVATTGGTNKTVTGLYAGEGDVNLSTGDKACKMDDGKYIGFTLDGTTLQAGDRINVHTSAAATQGGSHIIFYDNMTDKNELYETGEIGGTGDNIFTINAAMEGQATAYVYRSNADNAHKWNGFVDYIEVTRAMNPVMSAIQFNSTEVEVTSTTFAVALPYGTNVGTMTVTPTIHWNGAGTAVVTSNEGAWQVGANTFVVTDKDGDATTYTITLSIADHYEAQIVGGASYATLALAVDAAAANDVVKLLDNVDLMATGLEIAKNMTLDLNGFNIKAGEQLSNNINVPAGVKLTLVDNSTDADGKIYTEEAYTSAAACGVIRVAGEFLMQSGNIYTVIEPNTANKGQFAVVINAGGKVTVEGGQIKAGWYAISNNGNNSGSTIEVKGGELISTVDYAIYNPSMNSTVSVSGGVVYGGSGAIAMNRGELTVTGGTITSKGQGDTGTWGDGTGNLGKAGIYAEGKYGDVSVEISGGIVTAENGAVMINHGSSHQIEVAISGGQFSDVVPAEYCATGFAPITEPNAQGRYEVEDKRVYIFDGSTMTSMATSPSGAISWAKVGDTMGEASKSGTYDEVNYVKALQLKNSSDSKHFKIDVDINNNAKIEVIGMSNDNSETRHAWLTNSTEKGDFADAIAGLATTGYNPEMFATDWLEEGSYYLHADNTVNIFLIRVTPKAVPAKCEQPTITTQPATNLTFGAGNLTATVVAEVSDGGTLQYQWYNASDDSEVAGQTTATLTTTTEGTYYVIVTNTLDNHRDNSIKSDEAELGYRVANDATLSALGYGDPATAITLVPDQYEYNVYLAEGTVDVPELSATATMNGYASVDITDATAFVNYEATSTVAVESEDHTANLTYTVHFFVDHQVATLVDVTGDMEWDFSKANDGSAASSGLCSDEILSNVSGINNNDDFKSDNIMATANKFASNRLQASLIKFHTTVNGLIKVIFSNTGSKTSERYLVVNGQKTASGSKNTTLITYYGFVPAGDVVLTVVDGDGNMLNFASVKFIAKATADYVRDDSWMAPGELGTFCIPQGAVAVGADMYELMGRNPENGKIAFDKVEHMEPGKPYLFKAKANRIDFYYTDETAASEPNNSGAMKGSFVDGTLTENLANVYYFNGTALWSCVNLSSFNYKAYRAYVMMDEITTTGSNPAPGRQRVLLSVHGNNVATGVESIQTSEVSIQKVLINGELFILRGEKMYDATGRLVK